MQVIGAPNAASDLATPAPQPAAAASPAAPPQTPADLALVIEDDKASGTYVYKTVDRRTGQVIQQFPNDQLLRLREGAHYSPGEVVRQSA